MLKNKWIFTVISAHKAPIIVGAITVLCLSLFINKAFRLDDPLFIWTAKQINTNPADFYGFNLNWYGHISSMTDVTQNPPLSCYYIAIVSAFFGYSEIVLHIAFLFPAVAAAIGTYYLAKNFCTQPALAALVTVLTPGFLVSSTNIMCDTMMLAFWLWAVYFWIKGIEQNKLVSLFFAGLLIAFCVLTKYYGIVLLPLLFVYTIIKKRNIGIWVFFLLIPVLFLAEYQLYTYNTYGRSLISNAVKYAIGANHALEGDWKGLAKATLTGILFNGGCIISVLFFISLFCSKRGLYISLSLIFLIILILAFFDISDDILKNPPLVKIAFLIQAGIMGFAGIVVIWLALADFWKYKNAESILFNLWVIGTFVFAVFFNWTINARSLLPVIPVAGILLIRKIEHRINNASANRKLWSIAWPLIPSAVLAILICYVDYSCASVSRYSADRIYKLYKETGQTIWFQGHWGFQYYMQQQGAYPFDFKEPQVRKGDIIVLPLKNTNLAFLPENLVIRAKILSFQPVGFASTMSTKIGAGFYASLWGPLPFAFGPNDPEDFYIYIVK